MATNSHHYTIDASGKRLGRVASEAAKVLMGKHDPRLYARHQVAEVTVTIENAKELEIDERKQDQKVYTRYTGYPGGLIKEPLKRLQARKGTKALIEHAVMGMLPKNKLRARRMKKLIIND